MHHSNQIRKTNFFFGNNRENIVFEGFTLLELFETKTS